MINSTNEYGPKDFLDIHNVRIRPPMMLFKNAYEGRSYSAKLTIQNIGKVKVVIKITSPTSFAFNIKRMIGVEELSPGLSISRTIKYKCSFANVGLCQIPILINEHVFDYQIKVEPSLEQISISPEAIDFGTIDAGLTTAIRVLRLKNNGDIHSHFALDLPKQKPKLVAEPNRGQIAGMSFLDINIKLVSYEAGILDTEIWIKSKPPIRVPVKGEIIQSTFEPIYPTATETFTVIDFPPTYIGVKTTRNMMVRNVSSLCNMFCVLGEVNRQSLGLEECRENFHYYNYFKILPTDGRFEPYETKLFHFVFEPQKRKQLSRDTFYLCAFLIYRVRCQDIVSGRFSGGVFMKQSPFTTSDSVSTLNTIMEGGYSPACPVLIPDISEIDFKPTMAHFEQPFVRIYVHAVPEEPSVLVTPNEITWTGLNLGVKSTRILELKNNSNRLPIILHYKKVPYVDVDKAIIFLKPSATVQINVHVTPHKYGHVSTKVAFDLLFHDCPKSKEDTYTVIGHVSASLQFDTQPVTKYPKPDINPGLDPRYARSVGEFCQDIRFNTNLNNAKCITVHGELCGPEDDLVAFPNDTQRSIRPWRSNLQCRTIFTQQARYIPPPDATYEITITEKHFKRKIANFYTNFIRKEADRLRRMSIKQLDPVTDYALTIHSKLLCAIPRVQCLNNDVKFSISEASCIPLTPAQMNNVIISPSFIDTGSIAAQHFCEFKIHITNKNTFSVRIYVRPDKPNVLFPNDNRREVRRNSECDITVAYIENTLGYYVLALDLVVNDCMFVTITVVANVVPGIIPLSITEIEFKGNITHEYYDLKNILNVPISFEWAWLGENFTVHPQHGVVPAGGLMTCIIKTLPHVEGCQQTDLDLRTDKVNCQRIKLTSHIRPINVAVLSKGLIFKDMPLNRPVVQHVTIHNRHLYSVGFQVLDCGFGDIVLVAPVNGVIPPLAKSSFAVRIMMPYCVTFKMKLRIKIIHANILEVDMEGNVVYPYITVTPEVLKFGKIMASTTDTIQFNVTNTSQNEVSINFAMSDHHDFKISEEENSWAPATTNNYILKTQESKAFYLHFLPLETLSSIFYLPIVVNEIIGPSIYTDPITARVDFYLGDAPSSTEIIRLPNHVTCIKCGGFATKPKIRLSSLFLKFIYFPQLPRLSRQANKLTLTNNQDENEDVCIRTDHFQEPFHIDKIVAKHVKYLDKAIVISMPPHSKAVLHLLFNPHDYCIAESFLPLYIRSDDPLTCSRFVCLSGEYKSPSIDVEEISTFYCKPYPLQHVAVISKVIKLNNHFKECTVHTYTDLHELTIELKHDTYKKISGTTYLMECLFKTRFPSNIKFRNIIKLHCTCGSVWQSEIVGCAENCLLTNYAFADTFLFDDQSVSKHCFAIARTSSTYSELDDPLDVSKKIMIETEYQTSSFFTSYPFFPLDDTFDTQDYVEKNLTKFLLGVVDAAEMWFSTQVLFGSVYYSIPNGINSVSFDELERKGKKSIKMNIPFVNGLINLMGDQINKILTLSPIPTDSIDQAFFLYNIYQQVITFLERKGASFSYLKPEFLLPYDNYAEFSNSVYSKKSKKSLTDEILPLPQFFYIAKQSWCDLLLQTYKVLYLFRLNKQNITKSSTKTVNLSPMAKFLSSIVDDTINFDNRFSTTELLLNKWLQFNYDQARGELWNNQCPIFKDVSVFGNGMQDGLVLSAVTATYCPYLGRYYEKLYLDPEGHDQLYHNNIVVLKCWGMLNLSFPVTTDNLMHANCVHMLMLVGYLYDSLPFMYPTQTIDFKALLSEKISVEINLRNVNDFPIAYKPIIFGNENGCFTTECDMLVIVPPHKIATLVITYHAKFIDPVNAYILLSGECRGYHYAKNKCLAINGIPDLVHPTSTYNLSYPLYTFRIVNITVQSPYRTEAKYGLKLVSGENITVEFLQRTKYTHQMALNYSRIGVINKKAIFDKSGLGTVSLHVANCFYMHYVDYLYFFNDDVGHFMVKVVSKCKLPKVAVTLPVIIPKILDDPANVIPIPHIKNIYLHIPNRNSMMWDVARETTLNSSFGDERIFWDKYSGTTVGIHMLEMRMQDVLMAKIPEHLFCGPKTYTLTMVDNKNLISLPNEVSLGDECFSGNVKVPITFLPECTTIPKTFSFQMVSLCGRCIRNYIAKIKYVDCR